MNQQETSSAENVAWASLNTAMTAEELYAFCSDIERLFRINPYLEFNKWHKNDDGSIDISIRNISNQEPVDLETKLSINAQENEYEILYSDGIKLRTRFQVEENETGSSLKIFDEYKHEDVDDEGVLKQVDKSIVAWAKDIQEYIFKWQRWKWFLPWRWYMQGPWQRMKPPARRISYMLFWITFAELLGFFLIFIIFWYDFDEFFKL